MSKVLKFLEVRQKDDIYLVQGATRWGNRDLYPITEGERTYTSRAYFAYLVTSGVCITAWTLGSSLIGYGLTAGQACGAVLTGSVVACIMAVLCGQVGRDLHLGYPMMARAGFGLYGSYFVILIKCFVSFIFFGTQAYFGGQSIVLILNVLSPDFMRMKNTLPESAEITTRNLIGFLLYFVVFFPVIYIPPHKLQTSSTQVSSDWTRFAKSRNAPIASQLTAAPFTITLTALIGVLVTSATTQMYGVVMWNPLVMLQYVQLNHYTAACRAGTFFAGLGFLSSQLWVNMTQNTISSGMDLAGLAPKYLTMRRGALILAVCGIIIQPWRFLAKANVFITVLSAFGVFIAPITGVVIADFWVVRKQKWKIPDLYEKGGIYWFTFGMSWRAFVSFWFAAIPSMPGFIATCGEYKIAKAATWIFQLNYFIGLVLSFCSFIVICHFFPPEGLGISESFDDAILGEAPRSSLSAVSDGNEGDVEKGAATIVTAEKGHLDP